MNGKTVGQWRVRIPAVNEKCPLWRGRTTNIFECWEGGPCSFERCPYKIDESPITAEWLEEAGAEKSWWCHYFKIGEITLAVTRRAGDDVPNGCWLAIGAGRRVPLSHIKTRHEFRQLYKALSGKELGDG